jgi:hypothetical protein
MAQTAHLYHALEPRLTLAPDEAGIRSALHAGHPALWLPFGLLRDAPDLLTTWDVTSDSLALWLARVLNAERLVVVKACKVPAGSTFTELSALGVLDARFADWSRDAPFPIEVVGSDALEEVRDALLGRTAFRPPVALARVVASASGGGGQRSVRPRRKPAP